MRLIKAHFIFFFTTFAHTNIYGEFMEKLIEVSLKSIIYSKLQNDTFVMTLSENEGERQIPIIIGGNEAQSIIVAIEHIKSPRPLTHDLFCNFAEKLHIQIQQVVIYKFRDGIFYAQLILKNENEETPFSLDARTSDAVALAIRCKCPIFTNEEVLTVAGVALDKIPKKAKPSLKMENQSIETLQRLMKKAISEENYERAALIRDEIKKRNE